MASAMDYIISSWSRTLPHACSQASVVVCDHITPELQQLHWLPFCQRVLFKTAGLVYQLLELLSHILLMIDVVCRTMVVTHCVPIQMTCRSFSCHKHTMNLAMGVFQLTVIDCGMTFHPDCGIRDCPSTPSDDL